MTDEEYIRKKGTLDDLKELEESDGYAILLAEIKRLRGIGEANCCNVRLSSAERDSGAGARNMGDDLLNFVRLKIKALESSLRKEKAGRSRNRAEE